MSSDHTRQLFRLALFTLSIALAACGGVAGGDGPELDGSAGAPAECTAVQPTVQLDTGACSIAHEPGTRQCDADHTRVFRCTAPESQPMLECLPSLNCDPSVWCCPSKEPG